MTREGVIPTKEEGRRMGAVVRAVEQRPWYQKDAKKRQRRNRRESGGGAEIIMFQLGSQPFVYGEECTTCNATVLLEGCGLSVGSSVQVVDEAGCFFDVPESLLSGKTGFATKMKGGGTYGQSCQWVVVWMCCVEG